MTAIGQTFSPRQNNRTFVSEIYWLAQDMQFTHRGLGTMFNFFSHTINIQRETVMAAVYFGKEQWFCDGS
jgi:hypothetical protein